MGHFYSEKILYVYFVDTYFCENCSQLVACDMYSITDLFLLYSHVMHKKLLLIV